METTELIKRTERCSYEQISALTDHGGSLPPLLLLPPLPLPQFHLALIAKWTHRLKLTHLSATVLQQGVRADREATGGSYSSFNTDRKDMSASVFSNLSDATGMNLQLLQVYTLNVTKKKLPLWSNSVTATIYLQLSKQPLLYIPVLPLLQSDTSETQTHCCTQRHLFSFYYAWLTNDFLSCEVIYSVANSNG